MAQGEALHRIYVRHGPNAGRVESREHGHELRYEREARGVVDGELEAAGDDNERSCHVGEGEEEEAVAPAEGVDGTNGREGEAEADCAGAEGDEQRGFGAGPGFLEDRCGVEG